MNKFGLGAMETTNAIYDDELYKACVPETVPSFIVASNRGGSPLEKSGEQHAGEKPEGVGGHFRSAQQRHVQQPGGRGVRR